MKVLFFIPIIHSEKGKAIEARTQMYVCHFFGMEQSAKSSLKERLKE